MSSDTARRIRSQFTVPPGPATTSLEEQRRGWEESAAGTPLPPGTRTTAITMDGVPGLLVITPESSDRQWIVHLHGGGFTAGSPVTHRAFAAQLASAARAVVLLVDYGLAPEHPFPSARDDVITAYRWARRAQPASTSFVFSGDSAGGHVAVTAVLELAEAGDNLPRAVALLSPWLDLTLSGESMTTRAAVEPVVSREQLAVCARLYAGGRNPDDPELAPFSADLKGFPPLLIHAGADEILLSDAERMAQRARAAGVAVDLQIWPEMWHVWHLWAPELPEANQAIADIAQFFRRHGAK